MAHILRDSLQRCPSPRFAAPLGDQRCVSELSAGVPSGLLRGHAPLDEFRHLFLDVRLDLFSHLAVDSTAPPKIEKPLHDSDGRITRAIPSSMRSKLDISRSSCLRPTAVIL